MIQHLQHCLLYRPLGRGLTSRRVRALDVHRRTAAGRRRRRGRRGLDVAAQLPVALCGNAGQAVGAGSERGGGAGPAAGLGSSRGGRGRAIGGGFARGGCSGGGRSGDRWEVWSPGGERPSSAALRLAAAGAARSAAAK